jgi:hypothetical protein
MSASHSCAGIPFGDLKNIWTCDMHSPRFNVSNCVIFHWQNSTAPNGSFGAAFAWELGVVGTNISNDPTAVSVTKFRIF